MNTMNLLSVLRCLCPLLFFVFLFAISIIGWCQTQPRRAVSRSDRWTQPFAFAIIVTYISEFVILEITTPVVAQDIAINLLSLSLLWAVAILSLVEAPWFYRTGSGLAVGGFEVGLTILLEYDSITPATASRFVLALRIIRNVLLFGLAVSPLFPLLGHAQVSDLETQPLLPKPIDADQVDHNEGEDEDDGEDCDKVVKRKQKERLEASGNGWEYMKAFKVFLPLIVPYKDVKLQLCLLVTLLAILVERALGLLVPRQLGIVMDRLTEDHHHFPLKEVFLWMLFFGLNSSAGVSLVRQFAELPFERFSYRNITLAAFNHVMSLSVDFHNDSDSAEVIQAVNQGRSVGHLFEMIATQFLPEMIDLVIGCIYFFHLFGIYVCYILLLTTIAYTFLSVKFSNWQTKPRREYNDLSIKQYKIINQAIQGWQTVNFFNKFKLEIERVREIVADGQAAELRMFWKATLGRALRHVIVDIAFFAVCFIAILKVSRDEIPIGSFIVLTNYWWTLTYPIMGLTHYYQAIQENLIDAERLLILLQTKPSVVDREDANDLLVKTGDVTFDDVHFCYDPRKPTISNVNFEAKAGQTIAFVGETGGGKSTLLKLLFRCYDVSQGGIYIDGQNIRDVTLSSLRDALGIVDQSPYLFNISITENLKYGKTDATPAEMEAACKATAIHDKILTFPDGYASVVGQRGVKLSGGELQRIAIARVLLKNPKIVLLDEATSAVDTDTEFHIQAALKTLCKSRTTFVIAHRLSTVVAADLVLVVQDGRIIEHGTHRELSKMEGGKYSSLWSKQVAATVEGMGADAVMVHRVEKVVEDGLRNGKAIEGKDKQA